jgi:hypothetical protein
MAGKRGTSRHEEIDPRTKCEVAYAQAFSNLAHITNGAAEPGDSIRVACRGKYDWLAIARRTGSDGSFEVCFGAGESWWGALSGLNKALAAGNWKPDKYQKGRE